MIFAGSVAKVEESTEKHEKAVRFSLFKENLPAARQGGRGVRPSIEVYIGTETAGNDPQASFPILNHLFFIASVLSPPRYCEYSKLKSRRPQFEGHSNRLKGTQTAESGDRQGR